jgi:hypothetical protein
MINVVFLITFTDIMVQHFLGTVVARHHGTTFLGDRRGQTSWYNISWGPSWPDIMVQHFLGTVVTRHHGTTFLGDRRGRYRHDSNSTLFVNLMPSAFFTIFFPKTTFLIHNSNSSSAYSSLMQSTCTVCS